MRLSALFPLMLLLSSPAFSQAPAERPLPPSYTETYLSQQASDATPARRPPADLARSWPLKCTQYSQLLVYGFNSSGRLPRGETIEFVYWIEYWDGYSGNEWLHSVEIDYGPGWDWLSNFTVLETPDDCNDEGVWGWYPEWTDCVDLETHGPGFAFDVLIPQSLCPGGSLDGDPGNNWGAPTSDCGLFRWTLFIPEDIPLNQIQLNITPKSDGVTGGWSGPGCVGTEEIYTYPIENPCQSVVANLEKTAVCGLEAGSIAYELPDAGSASLDLLVIAQINGDTVLAQNDIPASGVIEDLAVGDYLITFSNADINCSLNYTIKIEDRTLDGLAQYQPDCSGNGLGVLSADFSPLTGQGVPYSFSYSWLYEGQPVGGENPFMPTTAGDYQLSVTVENCTSLSEVFAVDTFLVNSAITVNQDTVVFCPDTDTLLLTAAANGPLSWRLQYENGATLQAGQGDSLWIDSSAYASQLLAIASLSGSNNCFYEDTTYLFQLGAILTENEPPAGYCPGDTVTLSATGTGSYLWSTGDTTETIEVLAEEGATYSLSLTDGQGCTGTDSLEVPLNLNPDAELISPADTICPGASAVLIASGGDTYLWSTGDTTQTIVASPVYGGASYSVAIDDGTCIYEESLFLATYDSIPDMAISCDAGFTTLAFTWTEVPGLTYEAESLGAQPVQSESGILRFEELEPGTEAGIRLLITTASGCSKVFESYCSTTNCDDEEITITPLSDVCLGANTQPLPLSLTGFIPDEADEFGKWQGEGVISTEGGFKPAAAGAGTHEVIYYFDDGICTFADTVEVKVYQPLQSSRISCEATLNEMRISWPQQPQDTLYEIEILSGQLAEALADTAYLLDGLLPDEEVAFRLRAYSLAPCDSVVIEKSCRTASCPGLLISEDPVICEGDSAALFVETVTDAVYEWSPAAGLSCSDCSAPTASPPATTTYTVTVSDPTGCVRTQSVTVFVEEFPPAVLPETLTLCAEEPFSFCLPEENSYLWFSPVGFVFSGDCLSFPNPNSFFMGNYTVSVRRPDGCRFQETVSLQLEDCAGALSSPQNTLSALQLFPNPVTDELQLRTSGALIEEVQLMNLQGQLLGTRFPANPQYNLPMQQWPAGVYLLRARVEGQWTISRVVKK